MSSKKQARAYQKRREEQLRLKLAQKQQRRERAVRIGAIAVGAVAAVALIVWGVSSALSANSTAEPSVSPSTSIEFVEGWGVSPAPPQPDAAEGRTWTATIDTNRGPLVLELDGEAAPQAVASFVSLAGDGYFDGTECHRITTSGIFVLQCGDPTGTGQGGPAYRFGPIENAPEDNVYPAGSLAMARVPGDGSSMGSQFFIVYEDSPIPADEAGGYTVFGTVVDGLAMVEGVAEAGTIEGGTDGRPALSVILNEVSVS